MLSPNSVLANSIENVEDLILLRLKIGNYSKIVFHVGTQINGIPHIGTYLVQASTFVIARKLKKLGFDVEVKFGALDNSPYELKYGKNGTIYQKNYSNTLSSREIYNLISNYYLPYFDSLSDYLGINYTWKTYSNLQKDPIFRKIFLKSLKYSDRISSCLSLSKKIKIRLPSEENNFFTQKYSEDTYLKDLTKDKAIFSCISILGEEYFVDVTVNNDTYIDLNTLYRNIIKEVHSIESDKKSLNVMVKGQDWALSTQQVDWALGILGYKSVELPMRFFTPQIVTSTGAKLSKSLIRNGCESIKNVPEWILDMTKFREKFGKDYFLIIIDLLEILYSDPKHFFRSYSYDEIIKIIKDINEGKKNTYL